MVVVYDSYMKPWYSAFMMAELKLIYCSYLDIFMYLDSNSVPVSNRIVDSAWQ